MSTIVTMSLVVLVALMASSGVHAYLTKSPFDFVTPIIGCALAFGGAHFFIVKSMETALQKLLVADKNSCASGLPGNLLNKLVDNLIANRTEDLKTMLNSARTDIADMTAKDREEKLSRRLDEDIRLLISTDAIMDKSIHRISDEMRDSVSGIVAYRGDLKGDLPKQAASWAVDERALKQLQSALPGIIASAVASGDCIVWQKNERELASLGFPTAEAMLVLPLLFSGRFMGLVIVVSNCTGQELTSMRRTIRHLATIMSRALYQATMSEQMNESKQRDKLTGFLNRPSLVDRLKDRTALGESSCLLLIEGNGFGQLNESLGRTTADQLIQELGRCIENSAQRPDCVLYRTGAAQIALLLEKCELSIATRIGERIKNAVETKPNWPGDIARWTVSIAMVHSSEVGEESDILGCAEDTLAYLKQNNLVNRLLSVTQLPKRFGAQKQKAVGLSGTLTSFDPFELLRSLTLSSASGILRVTPRSGHSFWAYFEKGQLAKSKLHKLRGDDAVIEFLVLFDDADFVFKDATADMLTGTEDDVAKLGRSYSTSELEGLLMNGALARDQYKAALALVPTTSLYAMSTAAKELPQRWQDLEAIDDPPSQQELVVMAEILKLANGSQRLQEMLEKIDGQTTSRKWRCTALLLEHGFMRLTSLKTYAHV